jgi:hypothetical protein
VINLLIRVKSLVSLKLLLWTNCHVLKAKLLQFIDSSPNKYNNLEFNQIENIVLNGALLSEKNRFDRC